MKVMTVRRLLACVLALMAASSAAFAVGPDGRYKGPLDMLTDSGDPVNHPMGEAQAIEGAWFGGHIQGAASAARYSGGSTTADQIQGYWSISTPFSGLYAIGFAHRDEFPSKLYWNINWSATFVQLRNTPDYYTGAHDYYTLPQYTFAQQFQALGTSVTTVSCKVPQIAHTIVKARILQGGYDGPQIGPERYLMATTFNDGMACWSAGEVPTVPGQYYTVEFSNPEGGLLQLWYSRGRSNMGDDFYGGKSWAGDTEVPNPLRTVIGMDTDGVTSTVNTSIANQLITYVPLSTGVCGQTFVAKGTSLLSVDFRAVGNYWINPSNGQRLEYDMQVDVYQSPGPDGQGLNKVGVGKYAKLSDPDGGTNGRAVAIWFPGEVPLTPGNSYYVRFKLRENPNTGFFAIWCTNMDEYQNGQFYYGGAPQSYDISGLIKEETSSGSALRAKVDLRNGLGQPYSTPACTTRTSTTATIDFTTPGSSSTALVEYGVTPYTHSKSVTVPASTHSVVLTDLEPATQYHCRVTVYAANRHDTRSRDFVFVTEPETFNLLVNGGFENATIAPWSLHGTANGLPGLRNYSAGGGGFIGGVKAHTGQYYAGFEWNAPAGNNGPHGGIYQRVQVDPTKPVTAQAWFYSFQGDTGGWQSAFNFNNGFGKMLLGHIGIDPTGGTDVQSPNIVWSAPTSGQDWYDTVGRSKYVDMALTVQPQSDHVTVFTDAGQLQTTAAQQEAYGYVVYGWDDIQLTQPASAPYISPGDLDDVADGSEVVIGNLVVTATPLEAGAYYVEAADRSSGIRLESDATLERGYQITVHATVGTKPTGERYLYNADFPSSVNGTELVSLGATNGHIGNLENGLKNVGLLMRAWGQVVSTGSGFMMITDGSSTGDLKVDMSSAPTGYQPGDWVQVVGVVQLEGTTPEDAVPAIRPREDVDITTP